MVFVPILTMKISQLTSEKFDSNCKLPVSHLEDTNTVISMYLPLFGPILIKGIARNRCIQGPTKQKKSV